MSRRLSLFLMTALLVCAVSALELPELLQLADNTSNDYSTVIFQKNASSLTPSQLPVAIRVVTTIVSASGPAHPGLQITSYESLQTSPDLLHLFCVQRT